METITERNYQMLHGKNSRTFHSNHFLETISEDFGDSLQLASHFQTITNSLHNSLQNSLQDSIYDEQKILKKLSPVILNSEDSILEYCNNVDYTGDVILEQRNHETSIQPINNIQ